MNISRIALLSVILFVAPYTIATENPPVKQQDQVEIKDKDTKDLDAKKDEESTLSKIGGYAILPFAFVAKNIGDAAGYVAKKTYFTTLVSKLTATKYLNETRLNKPENIEMFCKSVVLGLTGYGLFKLYTIYNAQNEDNDDEMIFDSEEYDDNN